MCQKADSYSLLFRSHPPGHGCVETDFTPIALVDISFLFNNLNLKNAICGHKIIFLHNVLYIQIVLIEIIALSVSIKYAYSIVFKYVLVITYMFINIIIGIISDYRSSLKKYEFQTSWCLHKQKLSNIYHNTHCIKQQA